MKKTLLCLMTMILSLSSWADEASTLICVMKATPVAGYEAYCGNAIFEEWSDKVVIKSFDGVTGDDLTLCWEDVAWTTINGEACPWVYINNGGDYYGCQAYATGGYTGGSWTDEGGSFYIGAYFYKTETSSDWKYMYWNLTPFVATGQWYENTNGWYYVQSWEKFSISDNPVTVAVDGNSVSLTGILANTGNVLKGTLDAEAKSITFAKGQTIYYDDYDWEFGAEDANEAETDLVAKINEDGTISLDGLNIFYSGYSYMYNTECTLSQAAPEPDPDPITISARVMKSKTIDGYLYENWSVLPYLNGKNYYNVEVDLIGNKKLVVKNLDGNEDVNLTITFNPETGKVSDIKEAAYDNGLYWLSTKLVIDAGYAGCYIYPSASYVYATEEKGLIYISCYSYDGEANSYPYIIIAWGDGVDVSQAGFATASFKKTVAIPDGVTAYAVTGIASNGATLVLEKLGNSIPANYGVLIEGGEGFYDMEETTVTPSCPSSNLLVAVSAGETIPATSGQNINYVLQNQAKKGLGFYWLSTATVAKKDGAYLSVYSENITDDERVKAFYFGEQATGIQNILSGKAEIYDLNGHQLDKLQKGINIVNGKKIMVK